MLFTDVTRKQAFLTHLSFSLGVFFLLAYLIIFEWYPSYYLQYDGGDRGLITIFIVDVILGPGLTLLVFKPGKKGLKFDMTMILLFQAIALSWGVTSVYQSRPALTVFYDGKFSCLTYDDVSEQDMNRLLQSSNDRPLIVVLKKPRTLGAYSQFVDKSFKEGSSEIYYYSDLFVVLGNTSRNEFEPYNLDVDKGIELMVERKKQSLVNWRQYQKQHLDQTDVKYFPLRCRYNAGMLVYDVTANKIVDYVEVFIARPKSSIKLEFSAEEIRLLKARVKASDKDLSSTIK